MQVGQEVYYVPSEQRFGKPRFIEIEKVGRKWVTLKNRVHRFDKARFTETGSCPVDGAGYMPSGTVWAKKEDAEALENLKADLMRW